MLIWYSIIVLHNLFLMLVFFVLILITIVYLIVVLFHLKDWERKYIHPGYYDALDPDTEVKQVGHFRSKVIHLLLQTVRGLTVYCVDVHVVTKLSYNLIVLIVFV